MQEVSRLWGMVSGRGGGEEGKHDGLSPHKIPFPRYFFAKLYFSRVVSAFSLVCREGRKEGKLISF